MSKRSVSMSEEKFFCWVCEDLLVDPVTLSCGHSFCASCLKRSWDEEEVKEEEQSGVLCPRCAKIFRPRPLLARNSILADLVDELRKTGRQAASHWGAEPQSGVAPQRGAELHDTPETSSDAVAGGGEVFCSECSGRRLMARWACLRCGAAYCERHLAPHRDHPLADAHLPENVRSLRQKVQQRAELRERQVAALRQEAAAIEAAAEVALQRSRDAFETLRLLLQRGERQAELHILGQRRAELSRARRLEAELQEELDGLRSRDDELEAAALGGAPPPLEPLPPPGNALDDYERTPRYFEEAAAAAETLQRHLQEVLEAELQRVATSQPDVLLTPATPKTRADFLQFSRRLTLDPDTLNVRLLLSAAGRRVAFVASPQPYGERPQRFTERPQVLSRERLTGRCYWEVAAGGEAVAVAVAYGDVRRRGRASGFGHNERSWALYRHGNQFVHNSISTPLAQPHATATLRGPGGVQRGGVQGGGVQQGGVQRGGVQGGGVQGGGVQRGGVQGGGVSRVGVYLDHGAGLLEFYHTDAMTLIHRVQTAFTQPLHAGLFVGLESTAEIL